MSDNGKHINRVLGRGSNALNNRRIQALKEVNKRIENGKENAKIEKDILVSRIK
jgi:hypothetical protein